MNEELQTSHPKLREQPSSSTPALSPLAAASVVLGIVESQSENNKRQGNRQEIQRADISGGEIDG